MIKWLEKKGRELDIFSCLVEKRSGRERGMVIFYPAPLCLIFSKWQGLEEKMSYIGDLTFLSQ